MVTRWLLYDWASLTSSLTDLQMASASEASRGARVRHIFHTHEEVAKGE